MAVKSSEYCLNVTRCRNAGRHRKGQTRPLLGELDSIDSTYQLSAKLFDLSDRGSLAAQLCDGRFDEYRLSIIEALKCPAVEPEACYIFVLRQTCLDHS